MAAAVEALRAFQADRIRTVLLMIFLVEWQNVQAINSGSKTSLH
jgi:hypothetical protein